jgi:hypothetical protein
MSNGNVARMISGMDSGEHFELGKKENENTFNQQVDNYLDKFEKHSNELEKYAKELSNDLNGLEVMPLYGYVLIEPFRQNPFQKLNVTESGFIKDLGGAAPTYKSEEDGEIHEEQQYIKIGTVIETGHKCEFLKQGDIVMYPVPAEIPVPFYKFGWIVVNENRILAVVNEGLSQRKQDLQ